MLPSQSCLLVRPGQSQPEKWMISSPDCEEISCSLLLQLHPVICLINCRTDRKLLPRPAKTTFSNFQMYFEELSRSENEVKITSTSFSLSIIYGGGRQTKIFTRFQFCGRPPPAPTPPAHLYSRRSFRIVQHQTSQTGWNQLNNYKLL